MTHNLNLLATTAMLEVWNQEVSRVTFNGLQKQLQNRETKAMVEGAHSQKAIQHTQKHNFPTLPEKLPEIDKEKSKIRTLPPLKTVVCFETLPAPPLHSKARTQLRRQMSSVATFKDTKQWCECFRRNFSSEEAFCTKMEIKQDQYQAWHKAEMPMWYRWRTTHYLYTRIQEMMDKAQKARYSAVLDAQVDAWKKRKRTEEE